VVIALLIATLCEVDESVNTGAAKGVTDIDAEALPSPAAFIAFK